MDPIPASVVTAVSLSAAAGKNPWIPLGLLFLLAAPASTPSLLMEPELHRALHGLGPQGVLYGLGIAFVVLAVLDSLADKISFVQTWLVPISTAWRPFAAIAVSTIIGVAVVNAPEAQATLAHGAQRIVTADSGYLVGGSIVALTILAGTVFGWLATIGKTGTRLLLAMVPLPALRLAHSFLDDFFALAVSFVGIAFGDSLVVLVLAVIYLLVGLFIGPLLARVTWIHFRIGVAIVRKYLGRSEEAPAPPGWLLRALADRSVDRATATVLPAYTYRAPEVGRCRVGYLVFTPDGLWFATRIRFRACLLHVQPEEIGRVGLAQTTTARMVAVTQRTETGGLREMVFYLFPSDEHEVLPILEQGATASHLARVAAHSESARRGLPGYGQRASSVRYLPPERAGGLRTQALATLAAAIGVGLLSGGVLVPIGVGYFASPLWRRGVLGLAISGYLSLCVVASMGFGWPVAVLYATVLNTLALRDLTRTAIKARVDGFVDRRAFLPPVCARVWVPESGLSNADDLWSEGDALPVTDGPWRAVVALLTETPEGPPRSTAEA